MQPSTRSSFRRSRCCLKLKSALHRNRSYSFRGTRGLTSPARAFNRRLQANTLIRRVQELAEQSRINPFTLAEAVSFH